MYPYSHIKQCAASCKETLEERLMDSHHPKTELEWYAHRRVKELESENARLRAEVRRLLSVLKEINACLDRSGRFPHTVPEIKAAIKQAEEG